MCEIGFGSSAPAADLRERWTDNRVTPPPEDLAVDRAVAIAAIS